MQEELDRLARTQRLIVETREEIQVTKESKYYEKISTEQMRQVDIGKLYRLLLEYNSDEVSALESLELAIIKRKIQLSDQKKNLTSKINNPETIQ